MFFAWDTQQTMISVLFWDLSCSCSWNGQWKLPVNSLSGCYPVFPDSFSGFQMMLLLQFLGLALSEGISGCLWYLAAFQRCWLCFSIMLLLPRLTAPRLAGNFSPRILADFSHWVLFPLNQITFMAAHITCLLFDFISSHAVFIGNLYSC